ncbi:MAG: nucleoside-diphosphate-sugar epimerase [Candidatus Saccharibacteria bacterium]|nr:nucleoside-diphosphate-sugar epimerase [Candidatus Saccharibacteria bacterium]
MNKELVVISGINGFVGHHLARALVSRGLSVVGVGHEPEIAADIKDIVDEYYPQDLIEGWPDTGSVKSIIHLAGLAAVGPSFDNPQRYIDANSAMVTNLCEYYLKQEDKPRIIIVSSGAIYSPDQPMPITEESELGLTSPYAVSKVLNENQATYYRGRGLDSVVVRPFNHIGSGQAPGFILPDFYDRLSESGDAVIKVGSVSTMRDYTDVRDIVKAYALLALASELQYDTYNICSGQSLAGIDILDKLKVAMDRPEVTFEIDPALVRPTDIQEIVGDSSRLRNELQWQPEYTIDQTIADFVTSKKS